MRKYTIMLTASAIVLLVLMGVVQYLLNLHGAEMELLEKAQRDMEQSQRVSVVKADVESAMRNAYGLVENCISDPYRYYVIATQMVRRNPHIVGAGIAFRPHYYKDRGRDGLYAPYSYDDQPGVKLKKKKSSMPQVRTELLPFDYTDREWFVKPLKDGKTFWTGPYLDQGGTHIIMCTYAMPVKDKSGHTVGVFFADVPMEDVSLLSIDIHNGISTIGSIIVIVQVVSIIIIVFIIWLAVRASRRYKEQNVDVEKDHLIAEVEKLRSVNRRLTERNMELAKKIQAQNQTTDAHWFG